MRHVPVVQMIRQRRRRRDDQITIIIGSRPSDHYFRSVCLSVCLFVCLFVCARVFLSRLRSDLDQTRTYVICLGLVVSPRI